MDTKRFLQITFTLFSCLTWTATFAATSSTLELEGVIDENCSISTQATNHAAALDLEQTNYQGVGNVIVNCNSINDVEVFVNTINGFSLVSQHGEQIPYQITRDITVDRFEKPTIYTIPAGEALNGHISALQILINDTATLYAGTYTDTIEFTLVGYLRSSFSTSLPKCSCLQIVASLPTTKLWL